MSEASDIGEIPKRFQLSGEKFAKERMATVKEVVKSLQSKHPEVLSLCMFGSMTTGTARPESDIDGYLFVDVTKSAAARKTSPDAIIETQKSDHSRTPTAYFTEEVAADYTLPIRDALKSKLGLSDEHVEHIRSRPISREIIDQQVNSVVGQIQELEKYKLAMAERELNDPFDKPDSTPEEIQAYWDNRPEHPPFPDVGTNLSAMFHLETGGGIREYRQYLLDKLGGLGETGEKVWRVVIERTEAMEQHLRTGTEVNYPRSLEKAREVYGASTEQPKPAPESTE